MRWSRPLEGTPKTVTIGAGSGRLVGLVLLRRGADAVAASDREGDGHRPWPGSLRHSVLTGRASLHPGWYRQAERRLKTAQRRVSRRTKGSNRRRKAVTLLAKAHLTVQRRRADFHHKTALGRRSAWFKPTTRSSTRICRRPTCVKNHHLAKSISDAGWSQFLRILSFKAACAGRSAVAVPPAYTSQTCSGCGVLVHKGLSVRWHACPDCGMRLHRDHNAAKNIQSLGQRLRGEVA